MMADERMTRSTIGKSTAAWMVIGLAAVLGGLFLAPELSAEPVFGKAANGLAVALEIHPASWRPGDEIKFVCTVKNVSEKPVRVAAWGLDLAQALEVKDAEGNVPEHSGGRDATRPVPPDAFPILAPGKSKSFTLSGRLTDKKMLIVNELLGGVWHWQLADGEYPVRAVFGRSADEWLRRQAPGKYWTGRALSVPVKVTVGAKAPRAAQAVDGLKLTLSADKTTLQMTPRNLRRATKDTPRYNVESTKLSFTFTNVGEKPLKLNTYDLIWRLIRLDVKGPDEGSVRIEKPPFRIARMMAPPTEKDFPVLKPGESWTNKWKPSFPGRWAGVTYTLLKPGEYRVRATYTVTKTRTRQEMPHAAGHWVGSVTSNEIVLKAVVVGK